MHHSLYPAWLNELVYCTPDGLQRSKRKHLLADLCLTGLLPLLKSSGYTLRLSPRELVFAVSTSLFELWSGKSVSPIVLEEQPHSEEQFTLFSDRLDSEVWEAFWDVWGLSEDFQEDAPTARFRYLLPSLLWSWIDLSKSDAALQLEDDLEEQQLQEEASKGKEDPYLADTSRREYQDRHWH